MTTQTPATDPNPAHEVDVRTIAKTVQQHLGDRLTGPFFGPFVLTWILCNWRFLALIILGDWPIDGRIDDAVERYSGWWPMLGEPLLLAFAFQFLLPISNVAARWFSLFGRQWVADVEGRLAHWEIRQNLQKAELDGELVISKMEPRFTGSPKEFSRMQVQLYAEKARVRREDEGVKRAWSEISDQRRELAVLRGAAETELTRVCEADLPVIQNALRAHFSNLPIIRKNGQSQLDIGTLDEGARAFVRFLRTELGTPDEAHQISPKL